MEFIYLTGKDIRGKGNTEDKDVVSWDPPNYGYKLNIDWSFNHNTKIGGAGDVLRDAAGNWVAGYSAKINVQHLEIATDSLENGETPDQILEAEKMDKPQCNLDCNPIRWPDLSRTSSNATTSVCIDA
ncbi:hypothetical protein H5410_004657 [Solanum commersonii]|uniref:Uncharacterized protein n=1 Tax=Solanum commersonii TaxID=4109 RepID=A0A9J6B8S5_SOLCO|nr:hypothetical protein H5410_004657 [Solanum commersonii]